MTDPAVVSSLSFDQLIEYKKHYEALVKREGKGDGVFGKAAPYPLRGLKLARTIVQSYFTQRDSRGPRSWIDASTGTSYR